MKTGIMVTPRTENDRAAIRKMIVEVGYQAEWMDGPGWFYFVESDEYYDDLSRELNVMLARYDATARLDLDWDCRTAQARRFLSMKNCRVESLRKVVFSDRAIRAAMPAHFEGYSTFSVADRVYYDIPAIGTFEDLDFALATRIHHNFNALATR